MKEGRKPYKKPEVIKIQIYPEESVLGVCKGVDTPGPNQSQCLIPQCFNPY